MGDTEKHNYIAIILAIAGFWILDLSNNTLQGQLLFHLLSIHLWFRLNTSGPCRALVVDIASDEQQELANAIFSVWLGLGNVSGYLAGYVTWSHLMPWIETESCQTA